MSFAGGGSSGSFGSIGCLMHQYFIQGCYSCEVNSRMIQQQGSLYISSGTAIAVTAPSCESISITNNHPSLTALKKTHIETSHGWKNRKLLLLG
jgi:hypothetical protein